MPVTYKNGLLYSQRVVVDNEDSMNIWLLGGMFWYVRRGLVHLTLFAIAVLCTTSTDCTTTGCMMGSARRTRSNRQFWANECSDCLV